MWRTPGLPTCLSGSGGGCGCCCVDHAKPGFAYITRGAAAAAMLRSEGLCALERLVDATLGAPVPYLDSEMFAAIFEKSENLFVTELGKALGKDPKDCNDIGSGSEKRLLQFMHEVYTNVKNGTPASLLCDVMFVSFHMEGTVLMVDDIRIRACAMEKGLARLVSYLMCKANPNITRISFSVVFGQHYFLQVTDGEEGVSTWTWPSDKRILYDYQANAFNKRITDPFNKLQAIWKKRGTFENVFSFGELNKTLDRKKCLGDEFYTTILKYVYRWIPYVDGAIGNVIRNKKYFELALAKSGTATMPVKYISDEYALGLDKLLSDVTTAVQPLAPPVPPVAAASR